VRNGADTREMVSRAERASAPLLSDATVERHQDKFTDDSQAALHQVSTA